MMIEKSTPQFDFGQIAKNFFFEGEFLYAQPYGCGHINDTYAIYFKKSDGVTHRYILQRVNTYVFKKPEQLMSNIEKITEHLRAAIQKNGGDASRETLNLIPAKNDKSYYVSPENDYWRSYVFIEDAKTYEIVESTKHFENAGKAFGRFQKQLDSFSAQELFETIPNFHNTPKRFEDFRKAVEKDLAGRVKNAKEEIEFILQRKGDVAVVTDFMEKGKIPVRVTHNDTKFNNIMIDDKTGEGICVLDLDTVMPGSALYDFGDAIRFGASSALEDERDLSLVYMKIELFEAFARGFLSETKDILTQEEKCLLSFSAKLMTLECGMRFLGDYLNGDTYFKVHREAHNLDRARTQIKLVADMERKMDDMNKIIGKYIG